MIIHKVLINAVLISTAFGQTTTEPETKNPPKAVVVEDKAAEKPEEKITLHTIKPGEASLPFPKKPTGAPATGEFSNSTTK